MSKPAPVVYLLHGDDEFAMTRFIRSMQGKLGDATTAEMNTTHLEGNAFSIDALRNAAGASPFLATRRLVIVDDPTKKLKAKAEQEKFTTYLEKAPQSTALVLKESKELTQKNWLMKWAVGAGERAFIRVFSMPKGKQMENWIRKYAGEKGGEFSPSAASLLAEYVMESPRTAAQEIEKCLAYVNYARPVEEDDVDELAAFVGGGGDFFAWIDAIAARNGRRAMDMLQRLLDEQDALPLFFSLVGHFRVLLQTREVVENGGQDGTVAKELKIHPFRAKKMTAQAKTLSMGTLEAIYRRLLEYDTEIKTGQVDATLALETLMVALTG